MFLSYGGVIFDVVVPFLLIWTTYYPLVRDGEITLPTCSLLSHWMEGAGSP